MRLLLAAILCVIASASIAMAGPIFDTSMMMSPPGFSRGTHLVDLNKDGVDDLVTGLAASSQAGVAVAMATGGGLFAPYKGMFPNHGDVWVAPGDLDGDGWPDLAFIAFAYFSDSSHVGALYGNGTGAFVDSFEVRTPATAYGFAVGDLDGDGRDDVVVSLVDSSVAVYRSNGNRTLSFVGRYPTPAGAAGIAFGQLVGSPAVDVLISSSDYDGVFVFEGIGDGSLGARTDIPIGSSFEIARLAPLDAQPGLDLVLGFAGTYVASGIPGGFGPITSLPTGATGYGVVVMDFDGDGDLDIASGLSSGERGVATWLNDGAGNFGPRTRTARTALSPGDLSGGNVDGDGKPDLVYDAAFTYGVVIARGHGDGTFGGKPIAPEVSGGMSGLAAGDFDNDGFIDGVGALSLNTGIQFAKGHGDGTFDPFVASPATRNWFRLEAGRFDADANLDLVGIASSEAVLGFFKGHGDGTFDAAVEYVLPGTGASLKQVDLNGDGRMDIVVPCPAANALGVFLQGPAGLLAGVSSTTPPGPTAVEYADLNADSRLDRVLACTGQMAVQLDDGAGGWTTVHLHPLDPTPNQMALADFDEDGFPDVAFTQGTSTPPGTALPPARIHVLRGHPGGTFDSDSIADLYWYQVVPQSTLPGANMLFARDLDGDGHLDLLAKDATTLSFAIVARGRGDRTFAFPEAYTSPYSSGGMAVADFDGDGRVDVLGCGSNNSTPIASMTFLRNISNGVVGVPPQGSSPGMTFALTSISPNPARGRIAAVLVSARPGTARLALYSASGRKVLDRGELALVAGINRIACDVAGLSPGLYWLRATLGDRDEVATRKVVVAR